MSITHSTPVVPSIGFRWKKWLSQKAEQFAAWRKRRRQQRIDRLAFQQMLYLDPHLLGDIGYQQFELEDANNLPLDVNAAQAVRLMKAERRRKAGIHRH